MTGRARMNVEGTSRNSGTRRGARLTGVIAGGCLALFAPAAWGQSTLTRDLVRLDAGRQDTGPLATSNRFLPTDLRAPTGFEYVYRDPSSESTLMRISGGLAATFPRSQYNVSEFGPTAVIPAGTVFRIGLGESTAPYLPRYQSSFAFEAADARLLESQSMFVPPTAVDTRAEVRRPQPVRTADPAGPRSIWEDEFYRAARLRERLAEVGTPASERVSDWDSRP